MFVCRTSTDVFGVSQEEVQQINEQDVNYNQIYPKEKFKEQYVEQWLNEVEKLSCHSLLRAEELKQH